MLGKPIPVIDQLVLSEVVADASLSAMRVKPVPSRPFSSAAASANSLLTTVCMGHNYPSP